MQDFEYNKSITDNYKGDKIISLLSGIIVVFLFFPYLRVIPINTDNQPNVTILGIVCLGVALLRHKKVLVPSSIIVLLIPAMASVFILMLDDEISFNSFRSLYTYIGLFCTTIGAYLCFAYGNFRLTMKYIVIISLVWFIVGAIQVLFDKTFLHFLLSRFAAIESRGYGARGVSALSSEPSFYGMMVFHIVIFALLLPDSEKKNKKSLYFVIIAALFQAIFFAQSAISLLYFLLLFVAWAIVNTSIIQKLTLVTIILLFFYLVFSYNILEPLYDKGRFGSVIRLIIESNSMLDVLMSDGSINDRFYGIYVALRGSLDNYFLPNGFNSFEAFRSDLINRELGEFYWWQSHAHSRIQSGYGQIIYELGFFGLPIPLVLSYLAYRVYGLNSFKALIIIFTINITMFSAISVAMPFYGFLIAYLSYLNSKETILKQLSQ